MKQNKLSEVKNLSIFTNNVFLGEDISMPYNANFLNNSPEFEVQTIKYVKDEKENILILASSLMKLTALDGTVQTASVTYNSEMKSVFEGDKAITKDSIFGVIGLGVISLGGNEYNRYTFFSQPKNPIEEAE